MNFKSWLIFEESDVKTVLGHNPKKPNDRNFDFLTVYNTKEIYQILKKHGFRFFKKDYSWSIPRFAFDKLSDIAKNELRSVGVNIDLFQQERSSTISQGNEFKNQIKNQIDQENQEEKEREEIRSRTDHRDSNINQIVKQQLQQIKNLTVNKSSESHKAIEEILNKIIEEISTLTDEAKKGQIIKDFLETSSKIYHYSLRNQWLIYAQNPNVTDVQSKSRWKSLGRIIKKDGEKNAMIAFQPTRSTKRIVKEKDSITGEEKEKVINVAPTSFKIFYVYDIQDTEPDPKAKKPYQPHSWRQDSNDPIEELSGIISALIKYAKTENIPIKEEELNYAKGGYASKHGIVINNKYQGINKASTIIHELTHYLMHFDEKEGLKVKQDEAEHDAETVAYTVLKFFGFESKDSPVYLALWGANKEKVKERWKNIKDTVSKLLRAIHDYYEN